MTASIFSVRLGAALAIAALGLCLTPAAQAQSVGNQLVILKVDIPAGTYWLESVNGAALTSDGLQQAGSLGARNDVFLAKRNLARLHIVKANPLVYKYASERGELAETADYQAAAAFGKALAAVITILGGPTGPLGVAAGGADPADAAASDVSSNEEVKRIFKKHGIENEAQFRAFLRSLQAELSRLSTKTSEMPALFSQAKMDQTKTRNQVCQSSPTCTWDLPEIEKSLTASFDKVRALRADLAADIINLHVLSDPVNIVLATIASQEGDALKALATAKTFASAVDKIDRDLPLEDHAAYDVSHNLPITVRRTELTLSGQPLPATAAPPLTHVFTFRPETAVTYGFGAMFAYSFVRDTSFKAVKQGEQLIIAREETPDYVGRKVAGVLSISPTRWVDTPFTPVVEVGASADKRVGLFAGLGFSPYGLFHFGGGYTLQQVQALDGQNVGDVITSSDQIKTKNRFRSGGYLHISVVKKLGS